MKTNEIIAGLRCCTAKGHIDCKNCPAYSTNSLCIDRLHAAALNALEAQRKRVAELEQERRWIPVAERLPNDWEDVLVRLQCGDCVVAVRSGTIWRERWTNTRLDREPTHWMPLPEPPKESTP